MTLAQLYYPIYLNSLFLLLFIQMGKYSAFSYRRVLYGRIQNPQNACILFILCSLFIGLRPLSGVFVDTMNYVGGYEIMKHETNFTAGTDVVFSYFMFYSSKIMPVHIWFTIVAFVYFGGIFGACKRLFPKDIFFSFIICLCAFSCFTYGTNGIRNGMAASIVTLALTYKDNKKVMGLLFLLAIGVHGSMSLLLGAAILAYFYKNTKFYLVVWIACIFLSMIFGGAFESLFAGLIEDKRASYLTLTDVNSEDYGGKGGFRWDFLLYSAMPVFMGYYTVVKRKISNTQYAWLLNIYLISNAFWILIMRANFSNRFAYLSWFLYAVVLMYPLFKFPMWRDQYKKLSIIAFLHMFFTYIMWLKS